MTTVYVYPPEGGSSVSDAALLQQIIDNQGADPKAKAYLDFAVDDVDDATWTELIASVGPDAIKKAHIFMSSGEPLELAFGAFGAEVSQLYITPGGNGAIEIDIPANTRLSVSAVNNVTVNEGVLIMNLLG